MSGDFRRGLIVGVLIGFIAAIGWASRAQDWLVGSGIALHLDGEKHCNAVTSGAGMEKSVSADTRAMAGFYRNSNCRWSAYAGQAYLPLQFGPAHLGAIAGGVTGYGRPITPAAGLAVAIEGKRLGANLIFIPPFRDSGNVLWFQLKVPW